MRSLRNTAGQSLLFALLAALLTLSVLNQSIPARKTPARDYGIYVYAGAQILKGGLPYRDVWESKPPAIFYLDALALQLGGGTRWGVWAVEAISLLAAILVSFGFIRKTWGVWPAIFGLLAWTYGLHQTLEGGNLTEEYPLPLHFLALALFPALVRREHKKWLDYGMGLLFALCFLFRPNNAVVEAAILLTLFFARLAERDWRRLSAQFSRIALGAALPLGITAAYFQAHGLLQDLLEASVLYNLTYGGTPLNGVSPLLRGAQLLGLAVWAAAAGYVVAAWRLWRGDADPWLYALLLIGWPMVIFTSDPARRNYAHYYMNWLPFTGLLAGLALESVQRLVAPRLKESPAMQLAGLTAAIVLALTFFVSHGMVQDFQKVLKRVREEGLAGSEARSPLSIHINERTQPGDKVLFWGGYPNENYMSRRESPVAEVVYPLYLESEIAYRLEAGFLHRLETTPPDLIVDMGEEWSLSLNPAERERRRAAGLGWAYLPSNINEVFAFIDRNYYLEGKFRGLGIYRMKGTETQAP